jgi:hypothetical protein
MRVTLLCALAILCGAATLQAQEAGRAFNGLTAENAFTTGGAFSRPETGASGGTQAVSSSGAAESAIVPEFHPPPALGGPVPGLLGGPMVPMMGPSPFLPLPPAPEGIVPDKGHDPDEPPCKEVVWFSAGYTLSWIRPERVAAPLVTTGSPTELHAGALGLPGTTILFGDPINFGTYSGIKAEAGIFLDEHKLLSLEWVGQAIFPNDVRFAKASDAAGNPVIARPFFNVVSGTNSAFVDSLPGVAAGGATVDAKSEFYSTEFNVGCHGYADKHFSTEGLIGFRFLRLNESIEVQDQLRALADNSLTFQGNPISAGDSLTDLDRFHTSNNFYGFQLGGRVAWEGDWFSLRAFGKCALGATEQRVDINGSTTLTHAGTTQTATGGILALPPNIGVYRRSVLGYTPEGGLTFGVKVLPCLELTAGYSFLYWNRVVRPGQQIDPGVNPTLVPTDSTFGQTTGASRPVFAFNDERLWIHTMTLGLELHY